MAENKKVYVVGHKNPDTDSICTAIAYTNLKTKITGETYEPRRAGQLNEETQYVLEHFGVKVPLLLSDLREQIKNVELKESQEIQGSLSIRTAWEKMSEMNTHTIPITRNGVLEGVITKGDIAKSYMEVYDNTMLAKARTQYRNIAAAVEGEIVTGNEHGYFIRGKVVVGAFHPDTMENYIEKDDLVILGNRAEDQLCAIEMDASCIIVGLGVAALHNRFYTIELPSALAFFSGSRFVPIISTVVYVLVGIGMFFVWPMVQNGIYALGGLVTGTGYLGTLIFGIIKRALIPFGLHHVFYLPFWQTGVGGSMEVAGKMIEGGQNIFFAQLADPSTVHFSADACRYFSGEFIFMIFGLPGAALAMYQTAKPEKKKQAGGLLLSAALACMATGITEPLEFSFLFVAPMLFAV